MESTLPKDHKDRIAQGGFNSISHYNLVPKVVPMPQAIQILDAKAAVDSQEECTQQAAADPRRSRTCVLSLFLRRWHTHGRWANPLLAVVPSSRRGVVPPVRRTNGRRKTGLSGRHVVRGRQSSPIPAQQPAVIGGSKGKRQGNRQGW